MDLPYYRDYELAWSDNRGQEQRFRRLVMVVLLALVVVGAIWPFLPAPETDPYEIEELPPRIAKLLLQEKPPPPPPRVEPEPKVEPDPLSDPEPEQVADSKPEPAPAPEPVDRQQQARERAQAALLPFTEDFAALRDNDLLDKVQDRRELSSAVAMAARNERSMITSSAGVASRGINTAALSRNTGGNGLAERDTTQIDRPMAASAPAATRRGGSSGKASRSREEIELVFDRNKGAIFALYNRALRIDPTLQGKLVLRLTIAPSGQVTACEVISSELDDAELERKLVQRIRLFRFEARDVEAITTTKPIDFFPA